MMNEELLNFKVLGVYESPFSCSFAESKWGFPYEEYGFSLGL